MASQCAEFSKAPSSLSASAISNQTTVPLSTSEQPPTSSILHHFSKSQLALAFSIEKSRPTNVSTIEYCQRLRKRINTGRNIPDKELRYIDSVAFWKDECNRIYIEKINLEDKVNRLEEELRLRREAALQEDSRDSPTRSSIVRQLVGQHCCMTNDNSRKRQLPHDVEVLSEVPLNEELAETLPAHDNLLRISRYVYRIGREHTTLKNITQGLDLSNLQAAIAHNRELLLLIETAIAECCTPLRYIMTNAKDSHTLNLLQQLMRQVSLAVISSFSFLNVLCRTIAGREKRNHVVYRIAIFFDKALKILHDLSRMQASRENKQRGQKLLHIADKEERLEYAVNKYLAGALSSVISNFKWEIENPGHRPVLEGILYAILEHTGHLVSEAVFQEHVGSSKSPGHITEWTTERINGTVRLESRYIVQILHAALGSPEKKHLVDEVLGSGDGPHTQRQLKTSYLLSKKTNLIQNMLIKSAIGEDDIEILKFPAPPVEGFEVPVMANINVESYSPEWLIEMVWAMVGWDVNV